MSLWVDQVLNSMPTVWRLLTSNLRPQQFRPKTLDDLHYHASLSARLKSLVGPSVHRVG